MDKLQYNTLEYEDNDFGQECLLSFDENVAKIDLNYADTNKSA